MSKVCLSFITSPVYDIIHTDTVVAVLYLVLTSDDWYITLKSANLVKHCTRLLKVNLNRKLISRNKYFYHQMD